MVGIEFFSGSAKLTSFFVENNVNIISTDHVQLRKSRSHDVLIDFMNFDYKKYNPGHINFLYFGFPCTAFSKASGGKHFSKDWKCKTHLAHISELMIIRMFEIINYFKHAVFYIENPAGRLVSNPLMKFFISDCAAHIYRFDMSIFSFPTKKQTDLITNSNVPFLTNPVHRVNGKYQKKAFDNLTLKQRQMYTEQYCTFIFENFISNIAFGKNLQRSDISLGSVTTS